MNNFLFEPPKFLDPSRMLFAAGLGNGQSIADLGAGSGFYALAASKVVGDQGLVFAVDIMESALEHISAEARLQGCRNIKTLRADLEEPKGCKAIPTGSLDFVLLANIVHQIKNKKNLFEEVYRLLKTGGKLIAIEWNDQASPIGPAMADRIPPNLILDLAKSATLKEAGTIQTDNYHYGIVFIK